MRRAFAWVLLAGCGRIGFGPPGVGDDGRLTYRDAVLADAPIAYWRLADLDTTARDELGTVAGTYSGTCMHGVGGALVDDANAASAFDGSTCVVALTTQLGFPGNAPYTVEAWVSQPPPAGGVGYFHYVTRESRDSVNPIDGYALFQSSYAAGVSFERSIGGAVVHSPFATIATNRFVYLVGTYDGAQLELFVDAKSFGTAPDPRAMTTFAVTALLGAHSTSAHLLGVLDEVAIYDHVLPLARIELHHSIGVTGPE